MSSGGIEQTGFLSFVLHAHQPYVLHHGTWPHGMEWLLEAAAETYLPLLAMLRRLQADGIPFHGNISLSPVLLEQLAHADFLAELPQYLRRKAASAREDAAFFEQAGEDHLLSLARHWERVFEGLLNQLEAMEGDLLAGFRAAEQAGSISLLTSAATHGYMPLLGTDEGVRAQFQTAVATHRRLLGTQPRGAWLPECGYRPAGSWQYPVTPVGLPTQPPSNRIGVERALSEAGLQFTFVDAHLVEDGEAVDTGDQPQDGNPNQSLYRPHRIAQSGVAVFARDPRSAFQVWSAQFGYPGDFAYLDFHKKRWPGGHRYWRVTGETVGMAEKDVYYPEAAAERSRLHARHFLALVKETLQAANRTDGAPPILCAPFDLELFGHWWHEGLQFLENVARMLSQDRGLAAITCAEYLRQHGTAAALRMHEGSWGAGGDHSVWLNGETSSLLGRMYRAELLVRSAARHPGWRDSGTGQRIAGQMCRELLLLQASDWPTLITTGAARDYAERRFDEHSNSFDIVESLWQAFVSGDLNSGRLDEELAPLELQDSIFHDLNPANWQMPISVHAVNVSSPGSMRTAQEYASGGEPRP